MIARVVCVLFVIVYNFFFYGETAFMFRLKVGKIIKEIVFGVERLVGRLLACEVLCKR